GRVLAIIPLGSLLLAESSVLLTFVDRAGGSVAPVAAAAVAAATAGTTTTVHGGQNLPVPFLLLFLFHPDLSLSLFDSSPSRLFLSLGSLSGSMEVVVVEAVVEGEKTVVFDKPVSEEENAVPEQDLGERSASNAIKNDQLTSADDYAPKLEKHTRLQNKGKGGVKNIKKHVGIEKGSWSCCMSSDDKTFVDVKFVAGLSHSGTVSLDEVLAWIKEVEGNIQKVVTTSNDAD
ncbi:hypothetical protein M8C21_025146, partial [Ambrosia artemisiifolia]